MRLNLRNKRKKLLPARVKAPLLRPIGPNITWSLYFMHDTLASGKTIRTLNIIDDFNGEALSVAVDTSLPAQRVIRELENWSIGVVDPKRSGRITDLSLLLNLCSSGAKTIRFSGSLSSRENPLKTA